MAKADKTKQDELQKLDIADCFALAVKHDAASGKWLVAAIEHHKGYGICGQDITLECHRRDGKGDTPEERAADKGNVAEGGKDYGSIEAWSPWVYEKMAIIDALNTPDNITNIEGVGHLTKEGYAITGKLHPSHTGVEFKPRAKN